MKQQYYVLFFIIFCFSSLEAKKFKYPAHKILSKRNELKIVNDQKEYFELKSLEDILKQNPKIHIKKVFGKIDFDVPSFPLSEKFPHEGYFDELYILSILNGKVTNMSGFIIYNDCIIKDIVRVEQEAKRIPKNLSKQVINCPGKLAVIAQAGQTNYFHWLNEVLGRLALLEMHSIEYDKLYVSIVPSFLYMNESLIDLWGIDKSKIILPSDFRVVQADEVIVPSIIIDKINFQKCWAGHYIHPILSNYVREKLLSAAKKRVDFNVYNFAKKIFISRKDAYSPRRILNEDEVFKYFEEKGFERYELSKLSVLEQIILFHNADIVVSEHGAGLANILFCKPKTKIIEIFQALIPIDYWWTSQVFNLDYMAIQTVPIDVDYVADMKDDKYIRETNVKQMIVSIEEIKKIIANF